MTRTTGSGHLPSDSRKDHWLDGDEMDWELDCERARTSEGEGEGEGGDEGEANNRDGAYDFNLSTSLQKIDLTAEYLQTINGTSLLSGEKFKVYDIGAKYHTSLMGHSGALSADWSSADLGNSQHLNQLVLGAQRALTQNVWAGLEYRYSMGGSGVTSTIDPDAKAHAVIADITAAF